MEFLEQLEIMSKEEIITLLESERSKRIALEEECDLLAMENHILRSENQKLKELGLIQSQQKGTIDSVNNDSKNNNDIKERDLYEELIEEGNECYVKDKYLEISNACSGMNVIAISFGNLNNNDNNIIICGGTDKKISIYTLLGEFIKSYTLTAPILCMDSLLPSPSLSSLIAVGLMDGKHIIIDIGLNNNDNSINIDNDNDDINKSNGISIYNDHSKFVVGIRWNTDGKLLATCSRDFTVNLYKENEKIYNKISTFRYATVPESIIFISNNNDNNNDNDSKNECIEELVIALRETCYLLYIDTCTMQKRKVSMNVSAWDEHVSFNPLYLVTSPDRNFITIATDKNNHITLRTGTNRRLRSFSGHSCGDYGQPRLVFDSTGKYLYCNSDGDSSILVYSVGQEKIVHRLKGHSGIVRGIALDTTNKKILASCSHDGSVILWK